MVKIGHRRSLSAALVAALAAFAQVVLPSSLWSQKDPPKPAPNHAFFENRVRPILVEHCYECHSEKSGKQKGDLLLDRPSGWLEGGQSGPAVVPGNIEDSLLALAISHEDAEYAMPKEKLPEGKINVLKRWIQIGAPGPKKVLKETEFSRLGDQDYLLEKAEDHWSFQPVKRPELPPVTEGGSKHPVDRFIQARLAEKDLALAPPADRRTLLRRLSYDLIGLPPTVEEVEAFVADERPDAWVHQVDRLLASPHFGERWGRYWLDIARYADTREWQAAGLDSRYPFAYTYRDWVIEAFNRDLPFDQFLKLQIAADFYTEAEDHSDLAAMGFLTVGSRFRNNQDEIVNDRIDVLTRGVMGFTVTCARCHDHKYDPIPTSDYYALHSVFRSVRDIDDYPIIETDRDIAPDQLTEYKERRQAAVQAKIAYSEELAETASSDFAKRPDAYLGAIYDTTISKSATVRKLIAGKKFSETVLTPLGRNVDRIANNQRYERDPFWRPLALLVKKSNAQFPKAYAGFLDSEKPTDVKGGLIDTRIWQALQQDPQPESGRQLMVRYGEVLKKAFAEPKTEANAAMVAQCTDPQGALFIAPKDAMNASRLLGSGRRKIADLDNAIRDVDAEHPAAPPRAMVVAEADNLWNGRIYNRGDAADKGEAVSRRFLTVFGAEPFAKDNSGCKDLAEAMASADNPLTTRAAADRIWRHLLGQSLLESPDDMGLQSAPPSHPELLDFLATRFVADGWSTKKLIRTIVLSRTYRQASAFRPEAYAVDPENTLYWRREIRRLDFEAMRDSILAAADNLDLDQGGRAVEITAPPYTNRRTVYARIDRVNLDNLFSTFDFPSPDQSAPERPETMVPQQALYGMNDRFVIAQARHLSKQLGEVEAEKVRQARVNHLYRQLFQRDATDEEQRLASAFLDEARDGQAASAPVAGWQWGWGSPDPKLSAEERLKSFPFFDDNYRFAKAYPHPKMHHLRLSKTGGHPGARVSQSVIRRWIAPYTGTFHVHAELNHPSENGDGVRARILSSKRGQLMQATAHKEVKKLELKKVKVDKGEILDFTVDCLDTPTADGHRFTVTIRHLGESEYNEPGMVTQWSSQADFTGPPPPPLSSWEQLAHALFMTNEFLFVQ